MMNICKILALIDIKLLRETKVFENSRNNSTYYFIVYCNVQNSVML